MLKHLKSTYLGLPKSVYIIFFVRVVNSMGNFVFPFLTLLLTTKCHMSERETGAYLLLAAVVQVPGALIGGRLADKTGRKRTMVLFMGLAALCYIPCAFLLDSSTGIQYLPWILIFSSFFFAVSMPSSGAMMNDLTLPENRQAAFSLLYMGMNIGTAIGSIVAGFMFNKHMKLLFLGDAATTFISIILLTLFIKETKPSHSDMEEIAKERVNEKEEKGGLLSALLHRPLLLVFVLIDTVYSFVYAQVNFALPLQSKFIFGEKFGASFYGTFNMINCLEVIFFTAIIILLTKRIKAIYNVAMSGIFFGLGFGMLFFAKSFLLFSISTIVWTIGEIIHATNNGVYIANHTPISHRGRFSSVIDIISGTGRAVSPYIIGSFIYLYGVTNVWPIMFALSLISAFLMFILGIVEKRKGNHNSYAEVS